MRKGKNQGRAKTYKIYILLPYKKSHTSAPILLPFRLGSHKQRTCTLSCVPPYNFIIIFIRYVFNITSVNGGCMCTILFVYNRKNTWILMLTISTNTFEKRVIGIYCHIKFSILIYYLQTGKLEKSLVGTFFNLET